MLPCCGKTQPFIPPYPDLGICSHCRKPLGVPRPPQEGIGFQMWIASAVENMVAHQATSGFAPTVDRFLDFLKDRVSAHTGGNLVINPFEERNVTVCLVRRRKDNVQCAKCDFSLSYHDFPRSPLPQAPAAIVTVCQISHTENSQQECSGKPILWALLLDAC